MKNLKSYKLFEFESVNDGDDIPYPDHIIKLDSLYKRFKKELQPNISDKFHIKYKRGEEITVNTNNKDDLNVKIDRINDKISINVKPVEGVKYEFNYPLDNNGIESAFNTVQLEIEKPNQGLSPVATNKYKMSDEEAEDSKFDNLDVPITKKPKRRKRSININIIRDVLEDAFILDDIDLNVDIDELIRRMLLESRR